MNPTQPNYVVSAMRTPTPTAPVAPPRGGLTTFRAHLRAEVPPASTEVTATERLEAHVTGLLDNEAEIDQLITRSVEGDHMSPRELLELQALVYGYTQRVEVATRVVDKSVGALKQLLQMQV